MMKTPILATGLAFAAAMASADTPVLTVYAYDSFVSDWGPGPAVEAAFEETCNCDLQFVGAGDSAALLSRILLEGNRTKADIVLGLDTNLTARATETGLFAPHGQDYLDLDLPITWTDEVFVPFDWSYFAFVHRTDLEAPKNFKDLAESDLKIVIADPRSSTTGLGLLLWVKSVYGEGASDLWAALSDNIITVTKGWSEAYGMFLEGEADLVLSYTTSPAYHLIAEEDASKTTAAFDEGHYMQIEVAGKLAGSDQQELADAFLAFMTSDTFQSIIPTTNWMYPAKTPSSGLPDGFQTLITPEKALLIPPSEVDPIRDAALDEWLTVLSQ
jgi:thiamine transport system substrate-binding protein